MSIAWPEYRLMRQVIAIASSVGPMFKKVKMRLDISEIEWSFAMSYFFTSCISNIFWAKLSLTVVTCQRHFFIKMTFGLSMNSWGQSSPEAYGLLIRKLRLIKQRLKNIKETRRPDPDKYRVPLQYRLLFQEEGTHQKKLYVKTFPFPSTNRGLQRYIGRKIQLSRPLSFAKGVLKSHLFSL